MLAEIVTIGDELCRGEIVDTNSTWFAEKLWDLDIAPAWMTSCRDVRQDIRDALERAAARVDVIVVSGGLGPTEDDLTVDVVSEMLGVEPLVDQEAKRRWLERYKAVGRSANVKTERQLRAPGGARIHHNAVGAAPGFEVEVGGVPIICMPGVPREVESIWSGGLEQRLRELRDSGSERMHIARKTFRAFGRGESDMSTALDGLVETESASESIHYRVKFPEILIKLVVRKRNHADAESRLVVLEKALRERLGWVVFGTGEDTLASVVVAELRDAGKTISVVESCTGGLLGAALTSVAGSSSVFLGGALTYSNDAKVELVGVAPATLEAHGAVSEACALEMATGVRTRLGSDIGVAITGIAGPGGGTAEKPVGTVWLAIANRDGATASHLLWPGGRERVRRIAVFRALAFVRRELAKLSPKLSPKLGSESGNNE